MKQELFKKIITNFLNRDIENIHDREIDIPVDIRKVVSLLGPRRSGKTYLLYSIVNKLRVKIPRENIVYVNFEDDRLFPLETKDLDVLISSYYELYPSKKKEVVYFFFDEIQDVPHWEKFIRRIFDQENCRIYITGSSSKLLSREIATSLRGRTIPYEILPLNFREFLSFKGITIDLYSDQSTAFIKNALAEYLIKGGFPEVVDMEFPLANSVLQEYIDLVIYKDIAERHSIKNTHLLKYLIKHLFINVSNLLSVNKLFNDLKSQGFSLSKNTVYEYLDYLQDAFVISAVDKHSRSVREQVVNPKKIYGIDMGFRNAFTLDQDLGRIYENIVYLELRRKFQQINYFSEKQEVDFYISDRSNGKYLINVCYDLSQANTRKREYSGMIEALDYFNMKKGFIITSHSEKITKLDKEKVIEEIPLWKWLCTNSAKQQ